MQHPDEGTIHAWLDGELPAEESAALEAHVSECTECSAKVAEARGLVAASSRIVSALDIIPGGVIPASAPRRRPWHASTQLRAAAAVLIVAGASALVMRNGGERAMKDAVTVSAPIETPAAASLPELAAGPQSAARESDMSAKSRTTQAPESPAKESRKTSAFDQAARGAAPAPPVTAAAEPQPLRAVAADIPQRQTANANEAAAMRRTMNDSSRSQLNDIVVTGVATAGSVAAPSRPEFTKVRTDSIQGNATTTFATQSGVNVVLVDAVPRVLRKEKAADAVAAAPPPPPPAEAQAKEVFTISWIDKRGHHMTLRGAVPISVLERLRRTLPEDQR